MDKQAPCDHCGNDIPDQDLISADSGNYCCQGCRIVRENILASGLEEFYKLRDKNLRPIPSLENAKFGYLDDPDFQTARFESTKAGDLIARFYIEGARCQACLWVLEGIPERIDFVKSCRFSMDKSVLEIAIESHSKLSEVPKLITSYGYQPHIIFEDARAKELKKKERARELARLGVSFACAGNIMLLSASVYAGLEGDLRTWFDGASAILCVPSVTYCAMPFYRSSWRAFLSRSFSLDVSVSIGIVFGFLASLYHLLGHTGADVYFDTIATLVFLLLGSRYMLESAREKGLNSSEARNFFSNISAKLVQPDGGFKEVHSSLLKAGDRVVVEPGDSVPVDGIIEVGESYLNESVLSGESFPARKTPGEYIYGGTENQSERLTFVVESDFANSKMGKVLSKLQEDWGKQTKLARLSDRFSKWLVAAVSLLSTVVFIYFYLKGSPEVGLQRALAMVIITCPCALGFNIPVAMMLGMRKFAKHGIILKDDEVVEKISKVKNVFLDKTGTITSGQRNLNLEVANPLDLAALYALERRSNHPLARLVVDRLKLEGLPELDVEEFFDVPGQGPRGLVEERQYRIIPSPHLEGAFSLEKEGEVVGTGTFEDELDPGFLETAKRLSESGKKVFLLSGDKKERVLLAASAAQGHIEDAIWECDPSTKAHLVEDAGKSLMFGDGVNDAIALKAADVGVAATGGVDLALASSKVYFCSGGVERIPQLFSGCAGLIGVIKANIALSLAYNIVFISMSFVGKITPLAAALLMPLSSLTLLGASIILLRRLDILLRRLDSGLSK